MKNIIMMLSLAGFLTSGVHAMEEVAKVIAAMRCGQTLTVSEVQRTSYDVGDSYYFGISEDVEVCSSRNGVSFCSRHGLAQYQGLCNPEKKRAWEASRIKKAISDHEKARLKDLGEQEPLELAKD